MHLFDDGWFADLVANYGYYALFLVVALESAGVPMPGETMLIAAAVLAGTGRGLDIRFVVAVAAAAAIFGDNAGFWIGRRWGRALLARHGPRIGLDARKQMLGRHLFRRYGGLIVFLGRFAALLRTYAALLAGANFYPPWRFAAWNAAGGIVWAAIFGFGGFWLGKGIERVSGPIGWVGLLLAFGGGFALWRYFKHHEERLYAEAERAMDAAHAD